MNYPNLQRVYESLWPHGATDIDYCPPEHENTYVEFLALAEILSEELTEEQRRWISSPKFADWELGNIFCPWPELQPLLRVLYQITPGYLR